MTRKRITKEISDIGREDFGGITLTPSDDDIFLWKGSIPGPEGSCYEGGIFELEVLLPTDYP
jgi:ubiquitin-protein ligase